MRRSGPLRRRVAPPRPSAPRRRVPAGQAPRHKAPGKAPQGTGPSPAVRALVLRRDGYACVCCGTPLAGRRYSLQHRQRRSQGGGNGPENLIAVLGGGGEACHGRMDSRADPRDEEKGYTVRSGRDPALVPVVICGPQGGVTVWLTRDGEYSVTPPGVAA